MGTQAGTLCVPIHMTSSKSDRRSLFRFSLRFLFICLTVLCIAVGLYSRRVARQRTAVRFILQAGGREFHYIPCLNERHDWIQTLSDIVLKQLLGWTAGPAADALEESRLRAVAMGARA